MLLIIIKTQYFISKTKLLFCFFFKDDQVYLKDKLQRQEYVLTDTGLIWRGTSSRMQPSVWKYAQFEKDVLECSIYILTDVRKLPPSGCADVVNVARALSAGVKIYLRFITSQNN